MPELPEVETVRQTLLPEVTGRLIVVTDIITPGVLLNPDQLELPANPDANSKSACSGGWRTDKDSPCRKTAKQASWKITGLERRGKYLIIRLLRSTAAQPRQAALLVHLRMTGRLVLQQHYEKPLKHTHIRFVLSASDQNKICDQAMPEDNIYPEDSIYMDYHDTRRFGRIWLLPADKNGKLIHAPSGFYLLGPEPLEAGFTSAVFTTHLRRRLKTPVKSALLDQTVVAGLGNIYADEALFKACVQPRRPVSSLTDHEIEKLRRAIIDVLNEAISCQGTSLRDYVDGWNRKGRFQSCLMVYGRAGKSCRHCGGLITKTVLAGRTTCFCPSCQH